MVVNKNDYDNIIKDIIKNSKEVASNDELKKLQLDVETKLKNFNPTLMIYGTYNAGKSTLVNAIFGENEKAKTGDSPETAVVHPYVYRGYTIYDTPGINAPIKHEEATNEQISKCEIFLFVMSNDGSFEEKYVYEKISEIVKTKKPVLIVLNNKKSIDSDSKEAIDDMNKININLSKIGDKNGIENIEKSVSLCMVNAKTALKGKIENKKIMLKKSNILQLEKSIEILLNSAREEDIINALNGYIRKFVGGVIKKINLKIGNPELQKTEELLTFFEKLKQNSYDELRNIINRKTDIMESGLRDKLLSLDGNEESINIYIETKVEEINDKLNSIIIKKGEILKDKIEDFSKEIEILNIKFDSMNNINNYKTDEESRFSEDVKKGFEKAIKSKGSVKQGAETILNSTKKFLPKTMVGKGPVWIEKAAGKAAAALNVIIGVYDIYKANKKYNDEIAEKEQHVLAAKNKAKEYVESLRDMGYKSADDALDALFSELIEYYKGISKNLGSDESEFLKHKEILEKIIKKLENI